MRLLRNKCERKNRTIYSDLEEHRTHSTCDLKMCRSSNGSPDSGQVFSDRCRVSPDMCTTRPKSYTFHSTLGRVQSYSAVIFYLFIICFINNVGCLPAGSYSSTDWYRQQEDKAVVSYVPSILFIAILKSRVKVKSGNCLMPIKRIYEHARARRSSNPSFHFFSEPLLTQFVDAQQSALSTLRDNVRMLCLNW